MKTNIFGLSIALVFLWSGIAFAATGETMSPKPSVVGAQKAQNAPQQQPQMRDRKRLNADTMQRKQACMKSGKSEQDCAKMMKKSKANMKRKHQGDQPFGQSKKVKQ